jgi:hypothetical protein
MLTINPEKFHIVEMDTIIDETVSHILADTNNRKALALDFLKLQETAKGIDRLKTFKFDALVSRIFGSAYDAKTAVKYAQIAKVFSNQPDLWDFYGLSKLSLLLQAENAKAKGEGKSAYKFHVWYAHTINVAQNERHAEWVKENEMLLQEIEKAESDVVKDALRDKLTAEPSEGIDVPGENTEAWVEYENTMFWSARRVLANYTDKVFSDILKAYRGKGFTIDCTTGLPVKQESDAEGADSDAEGAENGTEGAEETKAPTPEELKHDAYTALLAYAGTFDKVPKTIQNAIDLLAKDGE